MEFAPILNMGNLRGLPDFSSGPRVTADGNWLESVKDAGYVGIQSGEERELELASSRGLLITSFLPRVERAGEIVEGFQRLSRYPVAAITLHVGTGFEDDEAADALFSTLLEAIDKFAIPAYVETHRSTLFQDPYRTLKFLAKYPQLLVIGDFSHWYTGCEFPYGDVSLKLDLIAPVLRRVRFIHARIGDSCSMQVALKDEEERSAHVEAFRQFWQRSFEGALLHGDSDQLRGGAEKRRFFFAPELLPYPYARHLGSNGREESDRWQQAQILVKIAKRCFDCALQKAQEPAG